MFRGPKVLCGVFFVVVLSTIFSCSKNLQQEVTVYENNFEEDKINGIHNAVISDYNGSKVLGRYSTGGFDLSIEELPSHDLIQVSFDLYIHDHWRGNSQSGIKDSSDIWIMNFDGNNEKYTTFSNQKCLDSSCGFQAYPGNYPFPDNPPGANAFKTDLPGMCNSVTGGTSKYRIVRTTYHTAPSFHLGCYAQLFAHQNSVDPLCEASWSIDNLKIKVIQFGK
jgi:hypothetical protein